MLTISESDAEKRLNQAKKEKSESYSVIVDDNMHKEINVRIRTKKETITLKKCQQIVKTVQDQFGIDIRKIQITMTQWDFAGFTPEDYLGVLYGDYDVPMIGAPKTAYYFPKSNTLRIWENEMPVYENANGVISRDADALADCLM